MNARALGIFAPLLIVVGVLGFLCYHMTCDPYEFVGGRAPCPGKPYFSS